MKSWKNRPRLRKSPDHEWESADTDLALDNLPEPRVGSSMAAQRRRLRQLRQIEEEKDARRQHDDDAEKTKTVRSSKFEAFLSQ